MHSRKAIQLKFFRMTAETSKDLSNDVYELMGYDYQTKKGNINESQNKGEYLRIFSSRLEWAGAC